MRLKQIKYFLTAAEVGGFTQAAKTLNVSQPALSRQIKLLEEELDGRLLIRGPSGTVGLSKLGQRYYEDVRKFYDNYSDLLSEYSVHGKNAARNIFECTVFSPTFIHDDLQNLIDLDALRRSHDVDFRIFEEKHAEGTKDYHKSDKLLPDIWICYDKVDNDDYDICNALRVPVYLGCSPASREKKDVWVPNSVSKVQFRRFKHGLKTGVAGNFELSKKFTNWHEVRTATILGSAYTLVPFNFPSEIEGKENLIEIHSDIPECIVHIYIYLYVNKHSTDITLIKKSCKLLSNIMQLGKAWEHKPDME